VPITPFHFGPGLAAKGLVPRHFSWSAFVASQVLIDCETAYNIAIRRYPLHRELHTFIGATAAGVLTGLVLIALIRFARLDRLTAGSNEVFRSEVAPRSLLAGGLFGGISHPFFDGLMHSDIQPFFPWSESNPLLGSVGLGTLHLGCLIAGIIGAMLTYSRVSRAGGIPGDSPTILKDSSVRDGDGQSGGGR
jgi:hypothetical protein